MQISIETPDSPYFVRRYEPGKVTINETEHTRSVVIFEKHLVSDFAPQRVEELTAESFTPFQDWQPDAILIGTGQTQHFLEAEVMQPLLNKGVSIDCMPSDAACRTFNLLVAEGRSVMLVLLV